MTLIHLAHATLDPDLSAAKVVKDLRFLLDKKPDIITLVDTVNHKKTIKDAADADGYRAVLDCGNGNEAFLINTSSVLKFKDRGAVKAADKVPGLSPARYVCWVKVLWRGETVWLHVTHWYPNLDKKANAKYINEHNAQTRQLAAQVKKHGAGAAKAFFAGDIEDEDEDKAKNTITNVNAIMRNQGLITIWDEKRVWPGTDGKKTVDVIGSYKKDASVNADKYKIYPKQNSSHRFFSAWYDVTSATTNPTNPADPDFYATGGNVSWADYYSDIDVYDLPQAVDESDVVPPA